MRNLRHLGEVCVPFLLGRGWRYPAERRNTMPTLYVRRVTLKDSLSDAEVVAYWQFFQEEFIPAVMKVPGVRSVKMYSGAGGLRADMIGLIEMDDAGVYERMLADPGVRPLIAKVYAAWDLKTAAQVFRREMTPELIRALSST